MPKYDRNFIDKTVERMSSLSTDSKPVWGSMTAPQMMAHLLVAVRYSLGKEKETPPEGGFLIRYILGPIFVNGILPFPKGVGKPALYDAAAAQATVDELKAEMEEFLQAFESNRVDPPPHPLLGNLGPTGWSKLHVVHSDHHLRQFGV